MVSPPHLAFENELLRVSRKEDHGEDSNADPGSRLDRVEAEEEGWPDSGARMPPDKPLQPVKSHVISLSRRFHGDLFNAKGSFPGSTLASEVSQEGRYQCKPDWLSPLETTRPYDGPPGTFPAGALDVRQPGTPHCSGQSWRVGHCQWKPPDSPTVGGHTQLLSSECFCAGGILKFNSSDWCR